MNTLLATKNDVIATKSDLVKMKSDLKMTIYVVGLIQFLAIVGSVLGILSFMLK